MNTDILYFSIGLAVFINICVSVFVLQRDDLDNFQKTCQSILIWLFPFLGSLAIYTFNKSHDEKIKQSSWVGLGHSTDNLPSNSASCNGGSDAGGGSE